MNIRSIAVFCGSQHGRLPHYDAHTRELGYILADHGVRIIYGGGNKGLMATVANAALERNGQVTGVIPELLSVQERQHQGLTELLVVDSMHTRKGLMYEKCDAAVILPGGYGTLDELFEMLTWNQLNIHDKHIFLLNSHGFYNHLVAHIHHMYNEGLLYTNPDDKISVINDPAEMIPYLNNQETPH